MRSGVFADGEHDFAVPRVHEHPAGEVANQREAKREIEKGIAGKHEVADLECRNACHAVAAAELHDADFPLVACGLSEEGLEQQGENEREDGETEICTRAKNTKYPNTAATMGRHHKTAEAAQHRAPGMADEISGDHPEA